LNEILILKIPMENPPNNLSARINCKSLRTHSSPCCFEVVRAGSQPVK
jgi:hypothetical protein